MGCECIKPSMGCRQYSFYNTHRSVQQPESSNADNRVSTVLTTQSSSLDHQMQAVLHGAVPVDGHLHSLTVRLWLRAQLEGQRHLSDRQHSELSAAMCMQNPLQPPHKAVLVQGTINLTSCTKSTNWLAAQRVQTGWLHQEYKLDSCPEGKNWLAAPRVQTGQLH